MSGRRMEARIQSKWLLQSKAIGSGGRGSNENQIPAMGRYGTGDDDKLVVAQMIVAKSLLSGAGNARAQPIRIWDRSRIDNVDG